MFSYNPTESQLMVDREVNSNSTDDFSQRNGSEEHREKQTSESIDYGNATGGEEKLHKQILFWVLNLRRAPSLGFTLFAVLVCF